MNKADLKTGPGPLAAPRPEERAWDVLCLGLNSLDRLCLVDGFPRRGGKLRMRRLVACGGGQSATAACALARLGRRVAFAGAAGDDEPGRRAGPWLEEYGVSPAGLAVKPGASSQQAFIMVEEGSGERTIVWHRDQACRLTPDDLDPDLIASCRVLHLDGHFLEASLAAARIAREHGVLVSLDGERVRPGAKELVSLCQVVVGCRDFAQRLTGRGDPEGALEDLARLGPLWVGRTMGDQGAELLAGGQRVRQPAFAVEAVDTTGAGDVFHAGLVDAILSGLGPAPAMRLAAGLAAISVTDLGGRAALPDRAGLDRFLAERQ